MRFCRDIDVLFFLLGKQVQSFSYERFGFVFTVTRSCVEVINAEFDSPMHSTVGPLLILRVKPHPPKTQDRYFFPCLAEFLIAHGISFCYERIHRIHIRLNNNYIELR